MSRGYLARTVVNRMSKIFLDFLARVSRFWRAFYTCGLQSSWQRRIDVVKPGRTSEKSTSIRPHIMSTCLVAPTARHCSIGTAFRRRQNLSSRKFQIRKRNSRCQASDHPAGTVSTSVEQFTDGTEDAVEISALQSSLSAEDNSAAEDDSTIEVGSSADDSTTEVVSSTCAGCSDNSKVAKAGDKASFHNTAQTENNIASPSRISESYSEDYLAARPAVAILSPFVVDYGKLFDFGNSEADAGFLAEVDDSDLIPILKQAAPFGFIDTGPLGFNYAALKASGPNVPGWPKKNLCKNYERELMHGRWAMLAVSGSIVQEQIGKGPWFTAGQVCTLQTCGNFEYAKYGEWFSSSWAGAPGSPGAFFTVYLIQLMLMWNVECYRTGIKSFDGVPTRSGKSYTSKSTVFSELAVRDIHPGGRFDPLGFYEKGMDVEERSGPYAFCSATRLKAQELRHGRLAMLAWLGFITQAVITNEVQWPPNAMDVESAQGPLANFDTLVQNLRSCPVTATGVGIPGCY